MDTTFKELVIEALKKMQKTVTTTTSYEVIRSNGMIIIQRTDKS